MSVTQSTLRLKQEIKTKVFHASKPKLAFTWGWLIHGIAVASSVGEAASGPQEPTCLLPLLYGPSPQTTCCLMTRAVWSLILYSPLEQILDNIYGLDLLKFTSKPVFLK